MRSGDEACTATTPKVKSMQPQPKTPGRYVFRSADVDERDGIPGCVIAEYRRCGKARCRCARPGEPPHGPYFYHFWREGGQAYKRYVARFDAPRVALHCERYRSRRLSRRAVRRALLNCARLVDGLAARAD